MSGGSQGMIALSTKAKEAIKVALAMVIAYYVAMRFDFMNSTWLATTVAMISGTKQGQSLAKAGLRMGGTLFAFVVGLFYLGYCPQDRWLFLLSFTPFLFLCAYMVQSPKRSYFWFVAGFVTLMITTVGPGSSEHAFTFAAFRALETAMGIALWAAVSAFIWPQTNIEELKKLGHDVLDSHRQLMRRYREKVLEGKSDDADGEGESQKQVRDRAGQFLTQLEQTINAAAAESYQVREVRHLWQRLLKLSLQAVEIVDRLDSGYAEMQKEGLRKIIENEEALFDELDARLAEARRLFDGEQPSRSSIDITIGVDTRLVGPLDHFERAAVEVTRSELERLDDLVAGIVDCVRDIEGFQPEHAEAEGTKAGPATSWSLGIPSVDPDKIRGALMVVTSMWAGFLIWIYFDPPGHQSWYMLVPSLTLAAVQAPFVRMAFLRHFAIAFAAIVAVYVFLLPHLSMFWELGLVLFAISFIATYFLTGLSRLGLFLGVFFLLGISNQQSYSFAKVANTYVFIMLALGLVLACSYITRSPRPEKAFMSLLGRFFRSCEFTLSRLAAERLEAKSPGEQMRRAYHLQELKTLPVKLLKWGKFINPGKFPGAPPEQIQAIVASLQVIVYRMEDLIEARHAPHSEVIVRELTEDIRAWRHVIEGGCRRWSEQYAGRDPGELRERLKVRMAKLNERVEETLNAAGPGEISDAEAANFYRLLGGFRGFSEAALVYADGAAGVDWRQLKEERFS